MSDETNDNGERRETFYRILAESSFAGIYVVQNGIFRYLNHNAASYAGYEPEELTGCKANGIVHPDDQEKVMRFARAMLKGLRADPYEFRIVTKQGNIRWIMETVTAIRYEGLPAILGNSMDVTEKKETETALRVSEERYRNIIEHSGVLFYTHAPNHVLTFVSANAEHFFGCTPEEATISWQEFLTDNPVNRHGLEATQRALETGERQPPYELELWKQNGETIWVEVHEHPVTVGGEIQGIVGTLVDVSLRKWMQRALTESEERYRTLIETTPDLVYTVDRHGVFTYANQRFEEALGIPPADLLGRPYTAIIPPESIPVIVDRFKRGIRGEAIPPYEVALTAQNGQRVIIEFLTSTFLDPLTGWATGRFGIGRNVTERRQAQDALKASEERYRTIIENIGDGYYEVDVNGNLRFANDACRRITGQSLDKIIGANFRVFFFPEDIADIIRMFNATFVTGESKRGMVKRLQRTDGKEQYVEISVSLKRDGKGKPSGFMGILHDVTERRKSEETIHWLAYHDALTGLPNRLLFRDRLVMAIAQAKRNGEQLAVMMMDLDKFKEINDTRGHDVGDAVLCSFTERIKKRLRAGDTFARTGGDEFMIIMPRIRRREDLAMLGKTLVGALAAPVTMGAATFKFSVSIGIALYPRDGMDFDALVKNADTAMYLAKGRGGNAYEIFAAPAGEKNA
ncbi:MAG TPA: PAS domain S-box protein [Syntrophales bacterium]|nr:PAS domain S-box protein [Syntrophales bacterium]